MLFQSGLIPKVARSGLGLSIDGRFEFCVSYLHPFEKHRYLNAKINEVGRDHKSLRYTELEDICANPLGGRKKLVFVTTEEGDFVHRYFKEKDLIYMEGTFSHNISSKFPGCRPIESSEFEKLIQKFSKEFFLVLQQDPTLNEYLNTWLKYFKDDFIKFGGEVIPPFEEDLAINSY